MDLHKDTENIVEGTCKQLGRLDKNGNKNVNYA